tara:strand:- start:276 stop:632 length:357 start_codon:yes stop_codon:yes gene_type:complete
MTASNKNWIPEIMYEEGQEGNSQIPFIMVPVEESMPKLLYIFESRETGELEPGIEGDDVPVVQWDLHQYSDMTVLKNNLSQVEYDNVRFALGLEPIAVAAKKGKKITEKVRETIVEAK